MMILDVITANKQASVISRYVIVMISNVITANKQAVVILTGTAERVGLGGL